MAGSAQSRPAMPEVDVAGSITVMVVGKPGIGKSTLVNGLLGQNVAEVGRKRKIYTEGVTTAVKDYKLEHNRITARVYDTPGLLDPTLQEETMSKIEAAYSEVDLLLLCIRITNDRFIEGDENNTIIDLLEKSGEKIWRKTLVVLVFANEMVSGLKVGVTDLCAKTDFLECLKSWEEVLRSRIPEIRGVVPTGHISQGKILKSDKYHWLSNFWGTCFMSLADDSKRAALLQLNRRRFTNNVNVSIRGTLEERQITITDQLKEAFTNLT